MTGKGQTKCTCVVEKETYSVAWTYSFHFSSSKQRHLHSHGLACAPTLYLGDGGWRGSWDLRTFRDFGVEGRAP